MKEVFFSNKLFNLTKVNLKLLHHLVCHPIFTVTFTVLLSLVSYYKVYHFHEV